MAGAKGFMVYAPEVSQTSKENTMNTFCEHHKDSIRFQYACFDRILLNGVIQLLLPPERAQGFSVIIGTFIQLHERFCIIFLSSTTAGWRIRPGIGTPPF